MQPPNGTTFPPSVNGPRGQMNQMNVPAMPSGFGSGGGATLESAFTGQSLSGNNDIQGQSHTRRERSVTPGLPSGQGYAGPHMQSMPTRGY
jgi:hypothetical protein